MALTENTQKIISVSKSIARYHKIRTLGYLLIPFLIGIVVVIHVNNHLRKCLEIHKALIQLIESDSQIAFHEIEENYHNILRSGTYLIYARKAGFLETCDLYERNIAALLEERNKFSQATDQFFNRTIEQIFSYRHSVENYNENFIRQRMQESANLFGKSPFPLDNNQQRAVIVDDTHNLVIAGAGAGKTETLITRIAYLVSRSPDTIQPDRILALTYQNKAAQEIVERLQNRFGYDVKIKTFHALGWEILQKAFKDPPRLLFSGENFDSQYQKYVAELFEDFKKTPEGRNAILKYIIFFGSKNLIKTEIDFSKKAEYYQYLSNLSYTALNGVSVKSEAECTILNYFLTHTINGKHIQVVYESPATWMTYFKEGKKMNPKPDFFLPEFNLYIEHWAVDKEGNVPAWFGGINAGKKYIDTMKVKRSRFQSQTLYSLLETYSWEFFEPLFLEKFQERLHTFLKRTDPHRDFVIEELYSEALIEKVWDENPDSLNEFSKNCAQFIQIAKTYHLTPADIRERLKKERWTDRQRAFAFLAVGLYEKYEKNLRLKNCIDFADMINIAIDELHKQPDLLRNAFDHILIDEFQDISTQRLDLIKAILEKMKDAIFSASGMTGRASWALPVRTSTFL